MVSQCIAINARRARLGSFSVRSSRPSDLLQDIDVLECPSLREHLDPRPSSFAAHKNYSGGFVNDEDRVSLFSIKFASPDSTGAKCPGFLCTTENTDGSFTEECIQLPDWAVRAGARETIYYNPESVNAAIVTCGGLCPGLNDAVQGLVVKLEDYGVPRGQILGIRYGFRGFYDKEHKPILLTKKIVDGIQLGGTILKFIKTDVTDVTCHFSRNWVRQNGRVLNPSHQWRVLTTLKTRKRAREPSHDGDPVLHGVPFLALGSAAVSTSQLLGNCPRTPMNVETYRELGNGLSENDPFSFVTAIGLLTLIVAVHECGHFLAARLQNIHVSKFAIGFGPAIARYQSKTVEYSIRAIPLGGFVAFPDDDPNSPYPDDDPDLLRNRPIADRALVISAGVVANFLFAFSLLFAQVCTIGVTNEVIETGVTIPRVLSGSAAEKAGLLPGDVILSVEGKETAPDPKMITSIIEAIAAHPNQPMRFQIKREDTVQSLVATPSTGPDGAGQLGIQLVAKRELLQTVAKGPIDGVHLASSELIRLTGEILTGLKNLVLNFSKSADQVSGPIAVIAMGAQVAQLDAPQLYLFAAVVNINLAVVNILPLPALDGGYLALLLLELLRGGKKLPQDVEQGVMASGILFLVALGCVLVVRDTVSLGLL
eukprot:g7906.t1